MKTAEDEIKSRIEARIDELGIEIDLFDSLYMTMNANEYNSGLDKYNKNKAIVNELYSILYPRPTK